MQYQLGSLIFAIRWLESGLTGTIGTSVAILAIATIGMAMLDGRMPLKRGAGVILGCFILFSSSAIANGLIAAGPQPQVAEPIELPQPKPMSAPAPAPTPYDPYAFASVPNPAGSGHDIFQSHP